MKNPSKASKKKQNSISNKESYYLKKLQNNIKDSYTKEEVINIIESIYSQYLGKIMLLEFEKTRIQENKERWETEHGKSLALLIENEIQKITLKEINNKLNKAYKQVEILSVTDPLTHLLNRRALIKLAEKEVKRAARGKDSLDFYLNKDADSIHKIPKETCDFKSKRELKDYVGALSVAILDIDSFKKVNDTYGHLIGDMVLKNVGKLLSDKKNLRSTDIVGRFGGEEFLIVLPDTSARNAFIILDKLIKQIRRLKIKMKDNGFISITVSIGISENTKEDNSINDIIKRADDALYRAKKNGKDQIIIYK